MLALYAMLASNAMDTSCVPSKFTMPMVTAMLVDVSVIENNI